jgi:hypothetical protein
MAVRVLLSPFWAGTAHVVQLGPIWIEQRSREPAPPLRRRVEDSPRSRRREQHLKKYEFENVLISTSLGQPCLSVLGGFDFGLLDQMRAILVR